VIFWIIAGALCLGATLFVLRPVIGGKETGPSQAATDVDVYTDQLRAVERERDTGALSEAEAETIRAEVGRRLLAASQRSEATSEGRAPRAATGIMALFVLGVLTLGSGWLYTQIGAPGEPDRPLASRMPGDNRPSQDAMQTRMLADAPPPAPTEREAELLGQLRDVLAERPDDATGYMLLVRSLTSLENYADAWPAQQRLLEILGASAEADDYATLAELMIFATRGYVSPEAESVLAEVLTMDPQDRRARYYSGAALAQNGRPQLAMNLWAGLVAEEGGAAAWQEPVRAQMRALAEETGVPLPADMAGSAPGPSREDVEAAEEMTEEERQAMIRGMVEGLSERLATEGGTPEEWARLIGALTVLGEPDRARAILDEAQTVFAGNDAALSTIGAAATRAGLTE